MSCEFESHLADTIINAGVTQMVEYHTFNMGVVGSSPATRTKTYIYVVELVIAHFIKIFWMQKVCH